MGLGAFLFSPTFFFFFTFFILFGKYALKIIQSLLDVLYGTKCYLYICQISVHLKIHYIHDNLNFKALFVPSKCTKLIICDMNKFFSYYIDCLVLSTESVGPCMPQQR